MHVTARHGSLRGGGGLLVDVVGRDVDLDVVVVCLVVGLDVVVGFVVDRDVVVLVRVVVVVAVVVEALVEYVAETAGLIGSCCTGFTFFAETEQKENNFQALFSVISTQFQAARSVFEQLPRVRLLFTINDMYIAQSSFVAIAA